MSISSSTQRANQGTAGHWPVMANAAVVGLFTTLAKLAAAVKIAVTARYFGAGDEVDAFFTAFLIPTLMGDVVATSFTHSLVPLLVQASARVGSAQRFARASLSFGLSVMVASALVLAVSAPWTLPVLGSSFSPAKLAFTQTLFWGLLGWLPLSALIACWRAVLNAERRFALAAGAPLITPLLTIAALYGGAAQWGIGALVWATLAGVAAEAVVLGVAVRHLGYPLLPDWTVPWLETGRQFAPLMLVAVVASANTLIDTGFAGMLGTGSVSALSYGSKLAGVASTIATMAIGTAVLPEFSRKIAEGNWEALRRAWRLYAIAILAVLVPVCAALAWLSLPLARLFFERGAFGAPATQAVAWVQRFALLEPPIAVLLALVSRLATALGANSLLLRISLAGAVVNFGGDWILAHMLGVAGIPIASAAARLVSLLVLLWLLQRREPRLFGDKRH